MILLIVTLRHLSRRLFGDKRSSLIERAARQRKYFVNLKLGLILKCLHFKALHNKVKVLIYRLVKKLSLLHTPLGIHLISSKYLFHIFHISLPTRIREHIFLSHFSGKLTRLEGHKPLKHSYCILTL